MSVRPATAARTHGLPGARWGLHLHARGRAAQVDPTFTLPGAGLGVRMNSRAPGVVLNYPQIRAATRSPRWGTQ